MDYLQREAGFRLVGHPKPCSHIIPHGFMPCCQPLLSLGLQGLGAFALVYLGRSWEVCMAQERCRRSFWHVARRRSSVRSDNGSDHIS